MDWIGLGHQKWAHVKLCASGCHLATGKEDEIQNTWKVRSGEGDVDSRIRVGHGSIFADPIQSNSYIAGSKFNS